MSNKEFEPFTTDIIHKEIDLIQSAIKRMSDRQAQISGVCLTVLVFLIGLFQVKTNPDYLFITGIISSMICIFVCHKLHINFLKTEKLYRMWYDFLLNERHHTKQWIYELNPRRIKFILKDQSPICDEHNPDTIETEVNQSWSLSLYNLLLIIMAMFYLPACFATLSAHLPILLAM